MINFTLQEVAQAVKALKTQHVPDDVKISGVSIDSRTIEEGQLFIPIQGERVNGHMFVADCIKRGAACCLWKIDEPNPPQDIALIFVDDTIQALQRLARAYRDTLDATFIGITGSSGKTSTKDIVASVCAIGYPTQKTQGNQNNEIGLPLTILNLNQDTQVAVIEMGISDGGEMDLLTSIVQPHIAIITSISESHIDHFGSMDRIVAEKFAITKGLQDNGVLFYNADTPLLDAYAKAHPIKQKMISYGFDQTADIKITDSRLSTDGLYFTVRIYPKQTFYLPLLGKHQINNAVAAILCAVSLGLEPFEIQQGFEKLELTGKRSEIKRRKDCIIIDDTYNANPSSMRAALDMLSEYPLRVKKIAVLGDMYGLGDQSVALHEQIGATHSFADIDELWVCGPLAYALADQAKTRHLPLVIRYFETKAELKEAIQKQSEELSMILVKASRGMALEDVIAEA